MDNNVLPAPDSIKQAERSMELLRVWIVDKHQEFVLSPNLWKDPGSWGLLLVDLAKHVALCYESQGHSKEDSLERIKAAFDAEWSVSTDDFFDRSKQ